MSLKIQIQERAKRKRNRLNQGGLRTPPGTHPGVHKVSGEPVFKPIEGGAGFNLDHFLERINLLLTPWWRRRH